MSRIPSVSKKPRLLACLKSKNRVGDKPKIKFGSQINNFSETNMWRVFIKYGISSLTHFNCLCKITVT